MTWLLWNIRGIHQRKNTDNLKIILKQNKNAVQLLVILEPKASHSEIQRFAYTMGFPYFYHGGDANQHIWILCKHDTEVTSLPVSSQAITIQIRIAHQ